MTVVAERGAVGRRCMDLPEVFNAIEEARIAALHGAFAAPAEGALILFFKRAPAKVRNP